MKLSEINPATARLMIAQSDLKKLKEQNIKLIQALKLAQSHINIFTPSKMVNPELNQIIQSLLNEIENES